jgi:helix-turn-helix protein
VVGRRRCRVHVARSGSNPSGNAHAPSEIRAALTTGGRTGTRFTCSMPEIGQTLRESRMRARIDISELEAETKIRAKYLRALENEEWDLLPGPTYVKSFLRSYADALGLDGRMLVEEYKLRHERLSEGELQPITPRSSRNRERRGQRRGAGARRDIVVAAVVLAVLAGLIAIGQIGGGDNGGNTAAPPKPDTTPTTTAAQHKAKPKPKKQAPTTVRLTLSATAPVYVCLRAAKKILIPAQTLQAGAKKGPFKAKRFAMTFGNENVRMRVNGKLLKIPPSSSATGYVVDLKGRHTLTAGHLPTCAG